MTRRPKARRSPDGRRQRHIKEDLQKQKLSNENSSGSSFLLSVFRGVLFLSFLSLILIFAVSFLLREEVKSLLSRKITEASSVILSRPFPLTAGLSIKDVKLENRLQRLQYRKVIGVPTKSGEYYLGNDALLLYIKEAWIKPELDQRAGLYELKLNTSGEIESISNKTFKTDAQVIWLEPELLSILGNSSQRIMKGKKLEEFSDNLKNAILAIEDEHFYAHFGIDPFSIIRAALVNLRSGRVVQGGSTLTQQLAKNLFFSSERKLIRKAKEAIAAIMIESTYSKDQIFEMYLNEIFLGQEGRFALHGFGEASSSFFGKEADSLSLGEAALLAALIKAPTSYSPRRSLNRALERQSLVLERMYQLGMITEAELERAKAEKIKIFPPVKNRRVAPYFIDYLQREVGTLLSEHALKGGALRIVSGIDPEYQQCAENAVEEGLKTIEKDYSWLRKGSETLQASLVSVVPSSGEVRAWVGGRDFGESQFDRISLAKRQPGSTFKPFVYLTALDGKLNQYRVAKTTSILLDEPVRIPVPGGVWEPKNYTKEFRGEVRLREALARSLNIPTVQLAQKIGIKSIARTGALFGFGDNLPEVPSLALGAGEVTPLELSQAYAIIANGGVKRVLRPFFHAVDGKSSEIVFQRPVEEHRVVSEGPVFILTDMLRTAVEQGTGTVIRRLGVKGPVAGKTGTTNDARDSWFVGFTPRILTTVWVGYDSNKPIKLTGSQAAAPIWASYMKCIAPFEPELDFVPPGDVVFKTLDRGSGLLYTDSCPSDMAITELFVSGTEPVTPCPLHSSEGAELIDKVVSQ